VAEGLLGPRIDQAVVVGIVIELTCSGQLKPAVTGRVPFPLVIGCGVRTMICRVVGRVMCCGGCGAYGCGADAGVGLDCFNGLFSG